MQAAADIALISQMLLPSRNGLQQLTIPRLCQLTRSRRRYSRQIQANSESPTLSRAPADRKTSVAVQGRSVGVPRAFEKLQATFAAMDYARLLCYLSKILTAYPKTLLTLLSR